MDDVQQEHLTRMKYLEACIKVCVRLYYHKQKLYFIKSTILDQINGSQLRQDNDDNLKMQRFSFFQESLRLYPSVPIIARKVERVSFLILTNLFLY